MKVVSILPVAALALGADVQADKNRPVTKVVTLIKDMIKQLEKEAEEDQKIYENMACWCTTNDKLKTKAIADAESRIKMLNTRIEELTALSAKLGAQIDALKDEVAKNEAALEQASTIRSDEIKKFNAEEKEMLDTIASLKSAVKILSKHNSFLQMPQTHVLSVAATLQHVMDSHSDMLKGVLTPSNRNHALAFIQDPRQSYNPQSGEIFGILTQMQEEFETNVAAAQKDEAAAQKAYDQLKVAKTAEIKAGNEQIKKKVQEKADTDERNAQSKVDLEDTTNTLSADEKFLVNLKEKCSMTDSEMEQRTITRNKEIEACSRALSILTGDDAADLFTRTFNFVQVEQSQSRRNKAADVLSAAATKLNNPRLSALAVRAKLDAFEKVKAAIDQMIAELGEQQAAEIKKKDFCTDELNKNQLETQDKNQEKSDLNQKIQDLTDHIDDLTKAINKLKAEDADMQVQLKRAGEDRQMENAEFQRTVLDQRATIRLLEKALEVLEGFYGKAKLLQEPAGPAPPSGFKEYKKNQASGGVMSMITQIIEDSKAMEAEAIKDETASQKAYEQYSSDTTDAINANRKDVVSKSEERSETEAERIETTEERDSAVKALQKLAAYNADLHKDCDYVLKNFDIRQQARSDEMEALKQAKAILSGAKFENFLQSA